MVFRQVSHRHTHTRKDRGLIKIPSFPLNFVEAFMCVKLVKLRSFRHYLNAQIYHIRKITGIKVKKKKTLYFLH